MKIKVKNKEYKIDDIALQEGKIKQATKQCITCGKDLSDDSYNRYDQEGWIPYEGKRITICKDCGRLFEKHKYTTKPKSWNSKEKYVCDAFKDIYSRKLKKAKEGVRKKMAKIIKDIFNDVKEKHSKKVEREDKRKKLEKEKEKIEKKINSLK